MKHLILAIGLVAATATAAAYAWRSEHTPPVPAVVDTADDPVEKRATEIAADAPVIDVVFALDTTGSMSGMINAAKDKIWSIASTMANAKTAPKIRIGLVAYRDRGDAYVTRLTDLSEDLDTVYGELMQFEAGGGGDTPESVHTALHEAVHNMSWQQAENGYRVIFLVGDAPGHNQRRNDPTYASIIKAANQRGITINAIQTGASNATRAQWQQIVSLGQGSYFQVKQNGGAIAMESPYDARIARLSRDLDSTRLAYGSTSDRRKFRVKQEATAKAHMAASPSALARRAEFNAGKSGAANQYGRKDLVRDVTSGSASIADIKARKELPEAMASMSDAEIAAEVKKVSKKRENISRQIAELNESRRAWVKAEASKRDAAGESLEARVFDTVREQAKDAGLEYSDDALRY